MAKTKDGNIQAPLAETLMYVGQRRKEPIPLERGNVFISLPPALSKALAKDRDLAAHFVPLSLAGKALRGQPAPKNPQRSVK